MLYLRQLLSQSLRRKYMFLIDYRLNSAKDPFSYYSSKLVMALIEIICYGPLLSLLVPSPDSLGPLHVVAWSDDQATEMANAIAVIKIAPTLSSYFSYSKTLLRNPLPILSPYLNYITKLSLQVTIEFTQQLMEVLKSVNTK